MFFLACCSHDSGQRLCLLHGVSSQLTSNVIHEMGSSCGISVRLTSSSLSVSSLNAKVKMAPGGVQVPTMRWWTGIAREEEEENGQPCASRFTSQVELLFQHVGVKRESIERSQKIERKALVLENYPGCFSIRSLTIHPALSLLFPGPSRLRVVLASLPITSG